LADLLCFYVASPSTLCSGSRCRLALGIRDREVG
jgi:hypothetical protein